MASGNITRDYRQRPLVQPDHPNFFSALSGNRAADHLFSLPSQIFVMHPPLATHKHQGCLEAIEALEECHRASFFNKFSGACNEAKQRLDQCLKEEVQNISTFDKQSIC